MSSSTRVFSPACTLSEKIVLLLMLVFFLRPEINRVIGVSPLKMGKLNRSSVSCILCAGEGLVWVELPPSGFRGWSVITEVARNAATPVDVSLVFLLSVKSTGGMLSVKSTGGMLVSSSVLRMSGLDTCAASEDSPGESAN